MNKTRNHKQAYRWGHKAEWLAVGLFWLKGYRVHHRRFKTHQGEIDLIVSKKNTLIFVEVKARSTIEKALESITTRQRLRIERAALNYIQKRPHFADYDLRFDVITCTSIFNIKHLPDAWRPMA